MPTDSGKYINSKGFFRRLSPVIGQDSTSSRLNAGEACPSASLRHTLTGRQHFHLCCKWQATASTGIKVDISGIGSMQHHVAVTAFHLHHPAFQPRHRRQYDPNSKKGIPPSASTTASLSSQTSASCSVQLWGGSDFLIGAEVRPHHQSRWYHCSRQLVRSPGREPTQPQRRSTGRIIMYICDGVKSSSNRRTMSLVGSVQPVVAAPGSAVTYSAAKILPPMTRYGLRTVMA